MASSDIDICKQALILLGEVPIQSFDDEGDIARICAESYPDFRRGLLTVHPWHFTMFQRQLALRADLDPIGWDYAHTLPSDRLSAPRALFSDEDGFLEKTYEVVEEDVYSNSENLWALYSRDVVEAKWDPVFTQFAIHAYAANIAMAVTEKTKKEDQLIRKAWGDVARRDGGWYARAKNIDSQRQGQRSIIEDQGPFIAARSSRSNTNGFFRR
ncbi:MAG: hypothetical protein L3J58_11860 [Emcibacter sp.]|nr:hypothetical protein [Emcibacter sp.]